MKKINFIKYLALISVLVFACDVKANTFPHGIYLGAGGGYNHTNVTYKNIVGRDITAGDPFFSLPGGDNDLRSAIFQAFVGYLHVCHKFCVTFGTEFFYSYIGSEKTFRTEAEDPGGANDLYVIRSKLRNEFEYGFKAILGYIIAETNHLYLLLGYSRNEFCRTDTFRIPEQGGPANIVEATKDKSFGVNNFIIGLGLERGTDHIRFGVEWYCRFNNNPTKKLNIQQITPALSVAFTSATHEIKRSHVILAKATFNLDVFTK